MSIVRRFKTGIYSVSRPGQGTYQDGTYISGPMENIHVVGSLQPTNARELKIEEEGTRLKQYYIMYSDDPILVSNTKNLADSDRVTINRETFKVLSVEHWEGMRLAHYKSVLAREPEQ